MSHNIKIINPSLVVLCDTVCMCFLYCMFKGWVLLVSQQCAHHNKNNLMETEVHILNITVGF